MKPFLAALIFFTRLPFWKIAPVPPECFKHVVPYWPLAGWLTGGVLAATLWLAAQVLPLSVAWMTAIVARLLVTGCLHEDGLADFCDGFGGGTDRERILAIMKDSHIGTYGVVGLTLYFLSFAQMGNLLPLPTLCAVALCADVYAKWCASHIINLLPYARREEESKARVTYSRMTPTEMVIDSVAGLLPVALVAGVQSHWHIVALSHWIGSCLCPPVVFLLLCLLMKRRIGGYTGDCCGAVFLLCELSFYLSIMIWK